MNYTGISIGIVVGIISGIIVLAILRTISRAAIADAKSVKMLSAQLLTVMTLVTGASFLVQSGLFPEDAINEIASSYFYSLAITFLVLMSYPLYRWVYKLGQELGDLKG